MMLRWGGGRPMGPECIHTCLIYLPTGQSASKRSGATHCYPEGWDEGDLSGIHKASFLSPSSPSFFSFHPFILTFHPLLSLHLLLLICLLIPLYPLLIHLLLPLYPLLQLLLFPLLPMFPHYSVPPSFLRSVYFYPQLSLHHLHLFIFCSVSILCYLFIFCYFSALCSLSFSAPSLLPLHVLLHHLL